MHLAFLRDCMEEQVVPISLLPRRLSEMRDSPFGELQRVLLKYHIESTYRNKQEYFKVLSYRKREFYNVIPGGWQRGLLAYVYRCLTIHCNALRDRLAAKLKLLISRSDWTTAAREQCVINLSSLVLSENEKSSLGFGSSFSCGASVVNPLEVSKGFCRLEKFNNFDVASINACKGFVYGAMMRVRVLFMVL